MQHVRLQVLDAPSRVIRFRHGAADLAHHVVQRCQLADVRPPRIERTPCNVWFAEVIEHELGLRTLPYQLDQAWQLMMHDARVERQSELRQHLHATHEPRSCAVPGVRLGLRNPSHSPHDRSQLDKLFEIRPGLFPELDRRVGDDRLQPRILARAVGRPARLEQGVVRRHVDLEVHHRLDIDSACVLLIVAQHVRPAQQRVAVEPRHAEHTWIPQVDVAVDDRPVRHVRSASLRLEPVARDVLARRQPHVRPGQTLDDLDQPTQHAQPSGVANDLRDAS